MSSKKRHFLFGYGSLISATSRAKTGETGQTWPVLLSGYQRYWSIMTSEFGMSSVAVVRDENANCNGVLIEIDENELPAFDEREQGYQRALISPSQLKTYQGRSLPEGDVWIYYSQTITHPSQHCPIVLSYLDVILAGCLDIGHDFAHDFVHMTQGWQHELVNDRQEPRYPRVQPELDTTELTEWLTLATDQPTKMFLDTYEA
ncbi:gamma-glutamylcyclotransferase [Marinomonas agarivorans]|nr:gamma-glutamylcyclotransferase [Marinomonas agarivorans]